MIKIIPFTSLLTLLCVMVPTANAAIVENIAIANAKAISLGNAVTADPPGIDSIHFNPAGLTLLEGRQYQLKILAAKFGFEVEFGEHKQDFTQAIFDALGYEDEAVNSTSTNSAVGSKIPGKEGINEYPFPVVVMPFGGASFKSKDSRWTFASAVYTPMASGYIRDDDDPGRFLGKRMAMTKITYFSPSVGYRVTDTFSVGLSVGMSWQGLGVVTEFRIPSLVTAAVDKGEEIINAIYGCSTDDCNSGINPYSSLFELEFDAEDSFVTNINVGLLWKPTPWFSWGLTYQAESTAHTEGTFNLNYSDSWASLFSRSDNAEVVNVLNAIFPKGVPNGRNSESGKIEVDLVLPSHLSTGISLQLTPNWKLNLDIKRSDWGSWEALELNFDQEIDFLLLAQNFGSEGGSTTLSLPRKYETVWNWGVGVEYQYSDSFALRMGYEPRTTSIPPNRQDVLLPLGDAELFGVGFEYKPSSTQTIDVGIAYLHAEADVPAGTSENSNSTEFLENVVYNPYAGTDFETQVNAVLVEFSYHTQF